MQVVWCLVGIVLVGVGVAFEVVAGVVTLAGEGLVLAICKAFKTRFDITKVVVDVSLVALACVASLLWLDGRIHGVREGTLARCPARGSHRAVVQQAGRETGGKDWCEQCRKVMRC